MSVAILRQGAYLIASIQSDLSDSEVVALRHELAELVGSHRARDRDRRRGARRHRLVRGSIVANDRAHRELAGAETVIVGIQPDVAIAMVQFRLNLARVALDLDAAIALLDRLTRGDAEDGG